MKHEVLQGKAPQISLPGLQKACDFVQLPKSFELREILYTPLTVGVEVVPLKNLVLQDVLYLRVDEDIKAFYMRLNEAGLRGSVSSYMGGNIFPGLNPCS